jgi:hypothetical protein
LSENGGLAENVIIDDSSQAHLEDIQRRIEAVLDAEIVVSSP